MDFFFPRHRRARAICSPLRNVVSKMISLSATPALPASVPQTTDQLEQKRIVV
jgi:hypothetical protein